MLRPQLEAALIFMHFTGILNEADVLKEVESYHDWVVVKMYDNAKRSNKFDLSHLSKHQESSEKVEKNYSIVKEKYCNNESDFKSLSRPRFSHNKRKVAQDNNMESLYLHIHAEASASIHVADVSDRVSYSISPSGISYLLNNNSDNSLWLLMLSNMIQVHLIKAMSEYFYPVIKTVSKYKINKESTGSFILLYLKLQ